MKIKMTPLHTHSVPLTNTHPLTHYLAHTGCARATKITIKHLNTHDFSPTHPLTHSLSVFLTHAPTHPHTFCLSLTHASTFLLSLPLTEGPGTMKPKINPHTLTLSRTRTLMHQCTLSLSHTHPCTHAPTLSHTCTFIHPYTHSLTHTWVSHTR